MSQPQLLAVREAPPGQVSPPVLRWVASDLASGVELGALPGVMPSFPLRRSIGAYDTATVDLVLEGAPPGWERATLPGSTVLHCYTDDDPDVFLWSGIVVKRDRQAGSGKAALSLSTGEYYLDRRWCGTYVVSGKDQCEIVSELVDQFASTRTGTYDCVVDGQDSATMPLTGIGITVEWTASATTRDRSWYLRDWVSVYDRMQDLSGVQGGPEWAMEWRRVNGLIRPFLIVADRLGTAGEHPPAYTMPGCLTSATLTEDYGDGKGANRVIGYSSGDGKTPYLSKPYLNTKTDRPTWDLWSEPSTSTTSIDTLNQHAESDLAGTAFGATSITLSASLASRSTPKLGKDVHLGDDIYYEADTPEFPGGIKGTARVEALEVGEGTISPIVVLNGPPERIRAPEDGSVVLDGNRAGHVWSARLPGRIIDSGRG